MTVSNGSTGRPGSGQVPTDSTPRGQSNGTPNGRGSGRDEITATRTAAGGRGAGAGAYGSGGAGRPGPTGGRPQTAPEPRTQPSASPRPAPVTSWAPKGRRPAPTVQQGNGRPLVAPPSNPPALGRPGTQPSAQSVSAAPPNERSRPQPDQGVPVWDPPPPRPPRVSLRERLGLGKKHQGDAASQRPTSPAAKTGSGAAGTGARPGAAAAGSGTGAAAPALPPPNAAPPRTSVGPHTSASPRTGTPPIGGPPTAVPPRTAGPDSRVAAAGTAAQPTTTDRAAMPGAGAPVPGGATAAQIAAGGPATTVGGGSAPPLYRTPPPVIAPGNPPLAPPVVPGVEPALVPVPGASGTGSTAVSAESLAAGKPKAGMPRRTRKARLRLSRLDPWSVMKTSFLFSIAAGIMLVVATYAVWTVLSQSGLFPAINDIVASVVSTPGDTTPFRIEEYINTQKVLGIAALIACVDVVIFTALATLGSFLYNLAATMLGGLEITLAED